ncbi:MAG: hypothetical protein RLZZ15_1359 [Verrucomicrobiota bacterium]
MKRPPAPPSPAAPSAASPAWHARAMVALVFALTLAAYWPALAGEFLWDDLGHVTRADLRPLGGLWRIWFEPGATQQYYPLLHSAFWLEHRLWGDAAVGYHLVNILLHASAACLFAAVLRTRNVSGAWFAALLFALHPVCVESVAWISEQKNTLSLVLYLGAALAYLRFDASANSPRPRRLYALATALFVAALLTKTVTASLPAALLVIFWWQRARLDPRRDVAPLIPWFTLSLGAGLTTAWFERTQIGADGAAFALGAVERGLLAGRVIFFYLGKLLWPADLIYIYERWSIDATVLWQYLFPLAAVGVAFGLWRARQRGLLAAYLLFVGSLFPALGFVNVYPFLFSWVADHFQYLPSLAVFALLGAGAARLPRLAPAVILVALGALTWRQAATYRDDLTLFGATLEKNPACWMAHNNLAEALTAVDRPTEALPHLEAALRLRPHFPEAENNLGDTLRRVGRAPEALPHLENALRLQPNFPAAHNNLGITLMALGRGPEGIAHFEQALRLNPKFAQAAFNLGLAHATAGRTEEALRFFARAVALDPGHADAELNWAIGLTLTGRFAEAEPHFARALHLAPDSVLAHVGYARALAAAGRYDEATGRLQNALDIDPDFPPARAELADLLRKTGRAGEVRPLTSPPR